MTSSDSTGCCPHSFLVAVTASPDFQASPGLSVPIMNSQRSNDGSFPSG